MMTSAWDFIVATTLVFKARSGVISQQGWLARAWIGFPSSQPSTSARNSPAQAIKIAQASAFSIPSLTDFGAKLLGSSALPITSAHRRCGV